MHFDQSLVQFAFMALSQWGYPMVFLFSIAESSPVFGVFIPGAMVVVAAGFFAKTGVLTLQGVIFLASLGAILGDLIGYCLGLRYGHPFLVRYGKYFLLNEASYQKTQKLMREHTGKALIIGRFHALTRSLSPFVAGATRIPFTKFLFFDLIAGAVWSTFHALIGYIFGHSYALASQYIGRFIFGAILLSLLIIAGYRFVNKRHHIFNRYYLKSLLVNLASLYLFAKMTEDVVTKDRITQWDQWVNAKIILWQTPALVQWMTWMTNAVSPGHILLLSLLLLVVLVFYKKWTNSLLFILSLGWASFSGILLKWLVHRPRPENALLELTGYSFPSGHATMATLFFSLLIYSFKDEIKNATLHWLFILGNIFLFLLIGFSRVYLNVHWMSDVIGGFALGLFWLTLTTLFLRYIGFFAQKMAEFWKALTH